MQDSLHNPALPNGQAKAENPCIRPRTKTWRGLVSTPSWKLRLRVPDPPEQTACQCCLVEESVCFLYWKPAEAQQNNTTLHGVLLPPPLGHASVPLLTPDESWLDYQGPISETTEMIQLQLRLKIGNEREETRGRGEEAEQE